jgi:anaerobic magnesium-protoporphyrin IX monomethyl ester cyclase
MDAFDLVLIHPPYHRRNGSGVIFPLGLGYIAAAVIEAGFTVRIIDGARRCSSLHRDSLEEFLLWLSQELSAFLPRLAIGIGPCTTSSVRSIKAISEVCKVVCPGIPLVYGGPLASIPGQEKLFFEEFSASALVPGDGEYAICSMLTALQRNVPLETLKEIMTPASTAVACNVVEDLDPLPFPYRKTQKGKGSYRLSVRRDLFLPPFATVVASRGCPYKCPFCMSGLLRRGRYQRRSLSNVTQEIVHLQLQHNVRTVVFYDDTFFPSSNNLSADVQTLVQSFEKLPGPIYWEIEMRPDILTVLEPNLAKQLFRIGCRQINVGIERGCHKARKAIGKNVASEELRTAIEKIRKAVPSMRLTGTFILGGPEETKETIRETVDFAVSLGLLFAHFYPLEAYPGTALFEQTYPSVDPLWWYEQVMKDDLPWGEIIYQRGSLDRGELLRCVADAYKRFYRRAGWHDQARSQLGKHYDDIAPIIAIWQDDRFALGDKS